MLSNKRGWKLLSFLLAFNLLLVVGCGSSATSGTGSQKEMSIRIAYNLPADHATGVFFETLATEIKKNTANTSIKLNPQTFPNGQLYNDAQLPDAVSTSAVEIGMLNVGFLAGAAAEPLRTVDLPFLFNSWEAEWAAEDGEYGTLFGKQLEKFNMNMLGWVQYGTIELYANKSVKVPADINGLKMRGFGQGASLLLKELGASPVSMSSQEIYQGMQHHTIDGYTTGPSSVVDRKLNEVTKHGTNMVMMYVPFQAVANINWWNSLPEDAKKAVLDAAKVAQKTARDKAKADDDVYKKKLTELGVNQYVPTPQERKQWSDAAKGRIADYQKKSGDVGKKLIEEVEKANSQHPAK